MMVSSQIAGFGVLVVSPQYSNRLWSLLVDLKQNIW